MLLLAGHIDLPIEIDNSISSSPLLRITGRCNQVEGRARRDLKISPFKVELLPALEVAITVLTPPPSVRSGNCSATTTTALPAVSAIPDIKKARAGILGLVDVGLPRAPAGLWT